MFKNLFSGATILLDLKKILYLAGGILTLMIILVVYHKSAIASATKELRDTNAKLSLTIMQDEAAITSLGVYINQIDGENTSLKTKINSLEYNLSIISVKDSADDVYGKYEDCKGKKYDYTKFDIIDFSR